MLILSKCLQLLCPARALRLHLQKSSSISKECVFQPFVSVKFRSEDLPISIQRFYLSIVDLLCILSHWYGTSCGYSCTFNTGFQHFSEWGLAIEDLCSVITLCSPTFIGWIPYYRSHFVTSAVGPHLSVGVCCSTNLVSPG